MEKNFIYVRILINLQIALAARGMRQVDLALRLGITPSLLSEVINGRRRCDSELRARIAGALGVDAEWLFAGQIEVPASLARPVETAA